MESRKWNITKHVKNKIIKEDKQLYLTKTQWKKTFMFLLNLHYKKRKLKHFCWPDPWIRKFDMLWIRWYNISIINETDIWDSLNNWQFRQLYNLIYILAEIYKLSKVTFYVSIHFSLSRPSIIPIQTILSSYLAKILNSKSSLHK